MLSVGTVKLDDEILKRAYQKLLNRFDPLYDGFGRAPPIPPSVKLGLFDRVAYRTGDLEKALSLAAEKRPHQF